MKFELFYSELDGKIHELETLEDKTFLEKQKGHIFCEECKNAKLKYVNATPVYLAAIDNNQHLDTCSNKHQEMSEKKMIQYVDSLIKDPEKLKKKLDSFETTLFTEDNIQKSEEKIIETEHPLIISNKTDNGNIITRRLRTKSLKNFIKEFWIKYYNNYKTFDGLIFDTNFLFYQKNVKLEVEKHYYNKKTLYSIYVLIHDTKTNSYKKQLKINRGEIEDKIETDKLYNIWFINGFSFENTKKFKIPIFEFMNKYVDVFRFREV